MEFYIKHETKGYLRVHMAQASMTSREADILQYYLQNQSHAIQAKVFERTADATVTYVGDRTDIICALKRFHYEQAGVPEVFLENSGRELNREYKEKLIQKVLMRVCSCMFLPYPIRAFCTSIRSVRYIYAGIRTLLKGKLEVEALEAIRPTVGAIGR